ncbi:MAG TPA: alpha-ketoglutarate-dependent dioxygenase AlkB [Sphingomicrobium sp.]
MRSLFPEPMVAGLDYRDDFISAADEAELLGHLHALELAPFRFQGWTGNRKTQSFGWRYDFDDASFTPANPLPDWLLPLRAAAATLAGAAPDDFVHVLIARYDPGAGIGWHRDRPVFDQVVGISSNSLARLRFRRRTASGFERFALNVEPRSAYLLSGEVRHDWEHSIAPGEQLRFSITFRSLSDLGRRKAAAQRIS